MDTNKEFRSICKNTLLAKKEDTVELEFQESLPQYCEDIEQIVKCCSSNVISDYEYISGTLKIYGKTRINIMYINSMKQCQSADFEETFTKNIDAPVTECFSFASIKEFTRFTNFRLINQRKVEVRISLKVCSKIFEKCTDAPLINCDNVIAKKEEICSIDPVACSVTSCDFDEEFSISQHNSNISLILTSSNYVVIEELRVIKDKILIKSRIELCVIYQNADNTLEKCNFSLSCSKITDVSGVDENSKVFAQAKIGSLFVKAVPDNDNNMRKIEVAGSMCISYLAANECVSEIITDSYSLQYNVKNSNSMMRINAQPEYYYDSKTLQSKIDFEDLTITEVIDLSSSIEYCYVKESCLNIVVVCSLTYYDASGTICFAETTKTLTQKADDSTRDGFGYANLLSFDYLLKSANQIELRLNVEYNMCLFVKKELSYVTDTELEDAQSEESPVMTIYFASEKESVWDIAKKFKTNSELIIKENELLTDKIESRRILLIPGV